MHISYKNRLLWQLKVTHPLAAIFYSRFTYPWRFTRVPSVKTFVSDFRFAPLSCQILLWTELAHLYYILLYSQRVILTLVWIYDTKTEKIEKRMSYNRERQKGGDLTQSYDKSPYTNRKVKGAK